VTAEGAAALLREDPSGTQLIHLGDARLLSLWSAIDMRLSGQDRRGAGAVRLRQVDLLRILTGLIPPSQGEVLCHGEPLRGLHPGASIVSELRALPVADGRRQRRRRPLPPRPRPAEARDRIEHAIDLVGLDGFEEAYPKECRAA
jgi:hypothetical protein